jgi:hypothetical protein
VEDLVTFANTAEHFDWLVHLVGRLEGGVIFGNN